MEKLFISHPYRAQTVYQIDINIQKAKNYARKYWLLGYNVLCPQANSAYMDGLITDGMWLEAYVDWLKLCDIIAMCGKWNNSEGCLDELALAKDLELQIIYDNILTEE